MPVEGAFAELRRLIERTREVATGDLMDTISKNLSEEAIDLIKQGFRDQKDPYGKPWAPKKKSDGRAILTGATGFLKGGWHRTKLGRRGFTVAASVIYAAWHQDGTKNKDGVSIRMVSRKLIPEGELPDSYSQAFTETIVEIVAAHFKK